MIEVELQIRCCAQPFCYLSCTIGKGINNTESQLKDVLKCLKLSMPTQFTISFKSIATSDTTIFLFSAATKGKLKKFNHNFEKLYTFFYLYYIP